MPLSDDVWVRMPPPPFEYHGPDAAAAFFRPMTDHCRTIERMVPTGANGQPAWGEYVRDPVPGDLHLVGRAGDRGERRGAIRMPRSLERMKREELPDRESSWGRTVDPATQEELLVPPYSSAEATIARNVRSRARELHTIRFFPDHGHNWPLWDPDFGYTATPDQYGLSDELVTALRRWYDEWEIAVGPGDGWRDAAQHDKWLERGDELVDWLTRELWDSAEIVAEHRAE